MDGKRYILDTNIVVPFLNGEDGIVKKVSDAESLHIPIIVVGELYYGAMRSSKVKNNIRNIDSFMSLCHIYPVNKDVAINYGNIKSELAKQGTPIPENDIWIAAISKTANLPLVTRDKHFEKIKGIILLAW